MRNFVQVSCINGRHESKSFSTLSLPQEGKYESEIGEVYKKDDNYYVDVLLNGSVYKGMYRCEPSFGVGVKHTLVKNEDSVKTITLVYQNGKWASGYAKGTILATFNVECNMEKYKVIYTDSYSNAPAFFDQVYDGLYEDDATPQYSGILPERTGYKFLGWESAIKTWINSKDANSNGEIIYKAKWESDGSVANLKYIV